MKSSPSLIPLVAPMEARLANDIPVGEVWQYEPKWDGFRCLAYVEQGAVRLFSKSGKRLDRYFPEIADVLARSATSACVLDGELTVRIENRLSFGALQARLHPAASRIERLSNETPARYAVFDCLQNGPALAQRGTRGEVAGNIAALTQVSLFPPPLRKLDRPVVCCPCTTTGTSRQAGRPSKEDDTAQ